MLLGIIIEVNILGVEVLGMEFTFAFGCATVCTVCLLYFFVDHVYLLGAFLIHENLGLIEFQTLLLIDCSVNAEILKQEAEQSIFVDERVEVIGDFGIDSEAPEKIDEDEISDGESIKCLLDRLELASVQDL